jgi:hypothetical protein
MLLIPKDMVVTLHAELDKALESLDAKLDACCGVGPGGVELELRFRRELKAPDIFIDYFVTAEVSNEGVVDSTCHGQAVYIHGVKYEV